MKAITIEEKAAEYSARLSNQSGNYNKGEIETAYVVGAAENEELAELELKDKAQKAFCRQQCKIVCWESDYNNRCPDFEEFVAELNQ